MPAEHVPLAYKPLGTPTPACSMLELRSAACSITDIIHVLPLHGQQRSQAAHSVVQSSLGDVQ